MSSPILTLGSFVFQGLESPERIRVTAKQRLNVHHLGSGSAAVVSLGNDFEIASFQGIFSGVDAITRIRALEYLRDQGAPLPLTWGSRSSTVIIQKLDLNYVTNQWVPYGLTCLVVRAGSRSAVASVGQTKSPDARVAEILNVLQESKISVSQGQKNALVTLAALNYDIASAASMAQTVELLSSIDEAFDLATSSPMNGLSGEFAGVPTAGRISDIVANAGQQTMLVSARGLVTNICVMATCVNS